MNKRHGNEASRLTAVDLTKLGPAGIRKQKHVAMVTQATTYTSPVTPTTSASFQTPHRVNNTIVTLRL